MKQKITRGRYRTAEREAQSAIESHVKARALSNALTPRKNHGASLDPTQTVRRIGGPAAAHSAPVIRSGTSRSMGDQSALRARPVIGAKRVLSVLMPAYKTKPYIDEAIESVLGQDLPWGVRLELIIGIDADEDLLGHVLSKWSRDGIVIFMNKKNQGPYTTLNSAFMLSTGDYIAIMDSDDIILPSHYAKSIAMMELDSTIDMVGGWTQWMSADGKSIDRTTKSSLDPTGVFLGTDKVLYPVHSTRVMRRGLYARLGGYRPWPCSADAEFMDRAIASDAKIRVTQEFALRYRTHPSQLTVRKRRGTPERDTCNAIRAQGLEKLRARAPGSEISVEMSGSVCVVRHDGRKLLREGKIGAVLPTIPGRERVARAVVESMSSQVDTMVVHLNGYKSVPAWAKKDNVRAVIHPKGTGPLVRFMDFPLTEVVFTCDDDIFFPNDYVRKMLAQIRGLGRGVALSGHGSILPPAMSTYSERDRVTTVESSMMEHAEMDLLGPGVAVFWGEDLLHAGTEVAHHLFDMDDDVWISFALKANGVRLVAAKKEKAWLAFDSATSNNGLYLKNVKDDFKSKMSAISRARQLHSRVRSVDEHDE